MYKTKNEQKIKTVKIAVQSIENKRLNQNRLTIEEKKLRKKPLKKVGLKRNFSLLDQVRHFFDTTTLHGLRYIFDTSISLCERLFWLLALTAVIGFATYNITNIYKKWVTNAILISISPYDADLKEFPFPAITICNMNQVGKITATRILHNGTDEEKKLINLLCHSNEINYPNTFLTWNVTKEFLLKISYRQSCKGMLKSCKWKNKYVNCTKYFKNYLTDEGLCCSFNRLPPEFIFKNSNTTIFDQPHAANVYDWTPEKGFEETYENYSSIPHRPLGPGIDLGLSVLLDAKTPFYFCSSTNSVGFKIFVSNPVENPRMSDFSTLIGLGMEIRYSIIPSITEAPEHLRTVSPHDRQCYFSNEQQLRYYRTYTETNCQLECFSNITYERCNCIPYFLPRHELMKICGLAEDRCINKAKEDLEKNIKNGSRCGCLPSCFEISFTNSLSYNELSTNHFQNMSEDYIKNNLAQVHFFFSEKTFKVDIKNRLFDFTEILANIGGSLGLCLGFSFLSFMEIIYFTCLKFFYRIYKLIIQFSKKDNLNDVDNQPIYYPFVN